MNQSRKKANINIKWKERTSVGKRDPEGEIVGVTSSMVTDGSPKAWAVNTLHSLVINKLFFS